MFFFVLKANILIFNEIILNVDVGTKFESYILNII